MECKICFEKYNDKLRKPYVLQPCCHTFCLECIRKLKEQFCPRCKDKIRERKPNFDLIEALEELETKPEMKLSRKIHLKLNKSFGLLNDLNYKLDHASKQRMNRLDVIRTRIKTKTNGLIQNLIEHQEKLLEETNTIELLYNDDFKEFNAICLNTNDKLNQIKNALKITNQLEDLKTLNEVLSKIDIVSEMGKIDAIFKDKYDFKENKIDNIIIAEFKNLIAPEIKNSVKLIKEDPKNKMLNDIIVSGNSDFSIKVWDYKSGSCIRTLNEHIGEINALKTISNKRILSGSSDHTIKLLDLETGKCINTLNGHIGAVLKLALISNNRIVSSGDDKSIKIWDLNNGKCINTFYSHKDICISLVTLSNDYIVCGGYFHFAISLIDSKTGECILKLLGHKAPVRSLEVISNKKIVSGSNDCTIKIWDLLKKECLLTLTEHHGFVESLAILKGNKIVSGSFDRTIKIWDSNTGKCIKTLFGHIEPIVSLAVISNDMIVSASKDKTIKIWNSNTGQRMISYNLNHQALSLTTLLM